MALSTETIKPRLALLVNLIAPYRVALYRALGEAFDLAIFYGGHESNRPTWQHIEQQLTNCTVKRSWGIILRHALRREGHIYHEQHIHITPGVFIDLLRFQPDAVLTIEMGFRTLAALLYGSVFRKPVWIAWEGTPHTERIQGRGFMRRVVRALVARWCSHWISHSQESTDYLMSLGIPHERIVQIRQPLDETLFLKPAPAALQLEPRPVLLYVGQFIHRKGVDNLLRAAASLQQEGSRFSLLLVGDGPEKTSLQDLANELGLHHTHFMAGQPPESMPGIYRSADCMVLPTLEDACPLVVSESLWSGTPVLCSIYAGGARDVLPQQNLFDPLQESELRQALRRALAGAIAPPDQTRLGTINAAATAIAGDIRKVLLHR